MLIGRSIFFVYASCLQVGGQDFTAPSFSIPISDEIERKWSHRYAVVRCKWHETPRTLTDYWQILVSDEAKPEGIEVDAGGAIVAPCTIHFWRSTPVQSIEILSSTWAAGEGDDVEEVEFDQALRFRLEDGKAFCIACRLDGPGVATEIHISEDEKTIESYLERSTCRLTIGG
jgi:hypothetical protein